MTNDLFNGPPPPPPPPLTAPPPYPPGIAATTVPPKVRSGQSITALVLGCTSILFYWTLLVPALAIVFAAAAMTAQRQAGQRADGMAIAGLVLGIVFLLLGIAFWFMAGAA
jgi:hypothetical protein